MVAISLQKRSEVSSLPACATTVFPYNAPVCSGAAQVRGVGRFWSSVVDIKKEVLAIIDEVLSLRGRALSFELETPLLGALPELDSMAVIALISLMEERFDFMVDDDEIDGSVFLTVGSLVDFVAAKLG